MRRNLSLWVLFITVLVSTPAIYSDTEQAYRNWALRCTDDGACKLEQQVFVQGLGEAPLVHVVVRPQQQSKEPVMIVSVPLGVLLAPGLQFQVDRGSAQTFSLHHCRSEGCLAVFPLAAELRHSLEVGREAQVSFTTLDGKRIGIPVSLLGITAGLKALDKSTRSGPGKQNPPDDS